MKNIESLETLDRKRPIHFIGIGGCGMSGVALSLQSMGYTISGSDHAESDITRRLVEADVIVRIGQNAGNIPSSAQLIVASAAVKPDNPEWVAAEAIDVPVIKYAAMLGMLMRNRLGIAVAGTHGKTTTTAMMTVALQNLGEDPGYVIGGTVPQLHGGTGVGTSDHLVVEACEYDRSFLSLNPHCAILNNIEEDHLDYYRDLDEIIEAFGDFTQRISPKGFLVYSISSPNIAGLLDKLPCRAVSCGLECEADYSAWDVRFEAGMSHFLLKTSRKGQQPVSVALHAFGRHNVVNGLSAIAMLAELGYPLEAAAKAVGQFRGVTRRFDILHDKEVCIVDDYAHHPTEVRTVLKSSRLYFKKRRLVVVFQPHQHSRTRFLMKDFAHSFETADLVVVPDIYFVRDSQQERESVHARDLVRAMLATGHQAVYLPSIDEIVQFLKNNLNKGDVLMTMGAGNVWQVGSQLAKEYRDNGFSD